MNIITKKVRLVPAPFVGTRIEIKLEDAESLTWGMSMLTLADDREKAIIDWGDGSQTELTETGNAIHEYAATGEYEVRISDDLSTLRCSTLPATTVYRTVYAPMIREFLTNARTLAKLDSGCFAGAVKMGVVKCCGIGLHSLGSRSFAFCDSIPERLDFPHVGLIASGVFSNSPNITELHFSAENFETIRKLDGFESRFGAENAAIFFDL